MRAALVSAATMWIIAWRSHRLKMSLALLLTILSGLAWPLFALSLRIATDAVIAHDMTTATFAAVGMSVVAIGALLFGHFAYVPYAEATETAVVVLEAELMELANDAARLEDLERPEFADRFSLVQQEISGFSFGMLGLMTTVALTISMTVTGLLLASVSPWLMLVALAAVPPVFTAQAAQRITNAAREKAARPERQAKQLLQLATTAGSAMELRVNRLQAEVRSRQATLWADAGAMKWRAEKRAVLVDVAGQFVFAVVYIAAVLFVVRRTVAGHGAVGDVFLIIILAAQVNQQVNAGVEQFRRLQRMAAGLTRLRWLRSQTGTGRPAETDAQVPDRLRTGIELRNVTFHYPGAETAALRDVTMTLPAGSLVAVVGENGAGKTTLVKLLCRLYDRTAGDILVDGTDIQQFPLSKWRQRVAAGFQDFARFELTAQRSVGVGDLPHLDDEPSVARAIARAGSGGVIARLQNGLQTPLGKSYRDGTELSGGQWQRLALARAMMREAPLLLALDEPTAALDAQAEHDLFERYAENARRTSRTTGTITVLVSHRFSTVRMADLILVIADGRIIESGTHPTLMAQNTHYAALYTQQAAAYHRH
jgi:ATP-binding cassette subfamily B protein